MIEPCVKANTGCLSSFESLTAWRGVFQHCGTLARLMCNNTFMCAHGTGVRDGHSNSGFLEMFQEVLPLRLRLSNNCTFCDECVFKGEIVRSQTNCVAWGVATLCLEPSYAMKERNQVISSYADKDDDGSYEIETNFNKSRLNILWLLWTRDIKLPNKGGKDGRLQCSFSLSPCGTAATTTGLYCRATSDLDINNANRSLSAQTSRQGQEKKRDRGNNDTKGENVIVGAHRKPRERTLLGLTFWTLSRSTHRTPCIVGAHIWLC